MVIKAVRFPVQNVVFHSLIMAVFQIMGHRSWLAVALQDAASVPKDHKSDGL